MANITELLDEKFSKIFEIHTSDLSDEEKAIEIDRTLSYSKLTKMYNSLKYDFKCHGGFIATKNYEKIEKLLELYEQYRQKGLLLDKYKCDQNELEERLNLLNELYKVLDANNIPYDEKVYFVYKNFKDIKDFEKKYKLFIKFGREDSRLDIAREALNNFEGIKEYISRFTDLQVSNAKNRIEIEKILTDNLYLENYLFAEFVIKTYVEDSRSYHKAKLLSNLGIDEETFKYCEKLIQFINPKLYAEYKEKIETDVVRRFVANKETLKSLAYGIENGILPDGTEFNQLEFYKKVPFKYEAEKFGTVLMGFILNDLKDPEMYKTMSRYVYGNKMAKLIYISEEKTAKSNLSYNGVPLTPEIIHNIFRYMKINDIPFVQGAYRLVLEKYINNELDFSVLDKKEEEYQAALEKKLSKYIIPYKLVRYEGK